VGLVRMTKFPHKKLRYLHRQVQKATLSAKISTQFFGKRTFLGKRAAACVDVAQRLTHMTLGVAFRKFIEKIKFNLRIHIDARYGVEHMQYGVVDIHEHSRHFQRSNDKRTE